MRSTALRVLLVWSPPVWRIAIGRVLGLALLLGNVECLRAVSFATGRAGFHRDASRDRQLAGDREAWERLRRGAYEDAIAGFRALLERDPDEVRAAEGLIMALMETGRYDEAEQKARQILARRPHAARLWMLLGEIHLTTGRYAEAEAAFDRALAEAPNLIRAAVQKGVGLWTVGRIEEARALFRHAVEGALRPRGVESTAPSAEEMTYRGRALVFLDRPHEAHRVYEEAIARDPTFLEAYVQAGELFVEKYNDAEAAEFFREALQINPRLARAHVGMARARKREAAAEALAHIRKALEVNPHMIAAHDLAAQLFLEEGEIAEAERHLQEALRVNPHALGTRALRAASFYLQDRVSDLEEEVRRIHAVNPRAGEVYAVLAEFAVLQRRYPEAARFAERAVQMSPWLWRAWVTWGITLLRLGRDVEGRQVLERAFAGDPFNIWVKNTLDLLDSMRTYAKTVTPHFRIRMASRESPVVAPLAAELLERAYAHLTERYQIRPEGPILVELFPNHEDFAVRTIGMPGLGALGACFGRVIAMDSPAARPRGSFSWGSTLWHEMVHVITLQATDYRIPRWLSEGLSVYEERRARGGWGMRWTLERVRAFAEGRFIPLRHLEAAFLRPRTPQMLALAYFQASLVVEALVERFGLESLRRLLALLRQGVRPEDAISRIFGLTGDDLDRLLREHVAREIGSYGARFDLSLLRRADVSDDDLRAILARDPENAGAHLLLGRRLRAQGQLEAARAHLEEAIRLFPFYTGPGNAYDLLAALYEERGEVVEAIRVLRQWAAHLEEGEIVSQDLTGRPVTPYEISRRIFHLARLARRADLAREALEDALLIYPLDRDLHEHAGEFYLEQNEPERAVRAFAAVLHLNPPDRAQAHYDLARALAAQGAYAEARREVVRALEIAPGFEKAHALLLKLVRGETDRREP